MPYLFQSNEVFQLESGAALSSLTIAYHTYGTMNGTADNVVWVCHALTANSDAAEWWSGIVGAGLSISPEKGFIVCANILGSPYGTTNPVSVDPSTGRPFYQTFPFITIRDMVAAHQRLRQHLGIQRIQLLVGGSMGGYQALEWCLMEPRLINRVFLIACSAKETPWGIAIHTAQRMAIEADATWGSPSPTAGIKGLKTARAIGMVTYRSYDTYRLKQAENEEEKTDGFKAESYIRYQGDKFAARFNAYSYWCLTKAMDSHNVARSRTPTVAETLQTMQQKTLLIAVRSDVLCPPQEMETMAKYIPRSRLHIIDSVYGHDGFLTEGKAVSAILKDWLQERTD